jgi:hypothetical protein
LLRIATGPNLRRLADAAQGHAASLGADNAAAAALQAARARDDYGHGDPENLRRAALDAVHAAHERSDRAHRSARSFRNQLLVLSGVLIVLAGAALALQVWVGARLLPNVGVGDTKTLALVLFFGCVGALFSAVPSLAQIPETTSPFNLPRQQALLKVVTGGWSAVIGLLVLDAGLTDGSKGTLSSVGALAILAAVFGAGQEAVTRFADHKASDILTGP